MGISTFPTRSTAVVIFLVGLAAGVYLQHRWPIGTWRQRALSDPAPANITLEALAQLPATRRLVVVVLGQSNAANYGSAPRYAGPGVYVFAADKLYAARDPLPGGDGDGGSIWTRLGSRLIASGAYDAVVFAVVARGSRQVDDFIMGGTEFTRMEESFAQLAHANLAPTAILWQQGETEGSNPVANGLRYHAALADIAAACHRKFPAALFLVAQSTRLAATPSNESIRLAQASIAKMPGCAAGPDLDALDDAFRSDGTHFNDRGLSAAADLWMEALSRTLRPTRETTTTP